MFCKMLDRNLPRSFRSIPLALLAVMVSTACRKPEAAAPPPPFVQVIDVVATDVPLHTTLIGHLDSPQNVEIRARVEGIVEEMFFTEGSEVAQGDRLFAIDKRPFLERLAAANGMLAESIAAMNKHENDVARLEPLVATGAVPQQNLDNAVAAFEAATANAESARARVESGNSISATATSPPQSPA